MTEDEGGVVANLTKEGLLEMLARAEQVKVWVGGDFRSGCYLTVDPVEVARKAGEIAEAAAVVEFGDCPDTAFTLYIESHL